MKFVFIEMRRENHEAEDLVDESPDLSWQESQPRSIDSKNSADAGDAYLFAV